MPTTEAAALYRVLAWLSPSYPVGAYSYSHGLEWTVEAGLVRDRAGLVAWLAAVLRHGGGWLDAVLLAHGHAAATVRDEAGWQELRRLAWAWTGTAELALETRAQGEAFAAASVASWPDADGRLERLLAGEPPPTYPLAVAAASACHGVPLAPALQGYLQAFAANLVSAAVRLVPLGQTDGQRTVAALEPVVAEVVSLAPACPLDELGTATLMVDLGSMRHESQYTRLFRS
jgi:urease accessory protein